MAKEYEFEPGVALLLTMRVLTQRQASRSDEIGDRDLADALRKRDAALGRKVRKLLREYGFERDFEIDVEMDVLALNAANAIGELGDYIAISSPKFCRLIGLE